MESVPQDVASADAAALTLLRDFPSLTIVVICMPGKAYVTRYVAADIKQSMQHNPPPRAPAAAGAASPKAAESHLIVLPARLLHYALLDANEKQGRMGPMGAPTLSGAADAFCAGFMVALGRGLSVRQALVWAYSTGQLSAMQPSSQLEGSVDDINELVRLELCSDSEAVGQLARPLTSAELAQPGPFSETAFLRQTPLHMAIISGRPSQLPKLCVPLRDFGRGADENVLAIDELSRMVLVEDSLGFNLLQRANDIYSQARKETVERKLSRRMMDWLLAAQALLSATQNGAEANRGNPLLSESRPRGLYRANSRSLEMPANGELPPGEGTWHQIWTGCAGAPVSTAEIFRKSMAVLNQVDAGKEVPRSVEEATASLATMVVVSILDDAGRRQRERRAPEARTSLRVRTRCQSWSVTYERGSQSLRRPTRRRSTSSRPSACRYSLRASSRRPHRQRRH